VLKHLKEGKGDKCMKKSFIICLLVFITVSAFGEDMMVIAINPNTFSLRGLNINEPFGLIQASQWTQLYYNIAESDVNNQVSIYRWAGYTPRYTNGKDYTIISLTQSGSVSYYIYYFFNKMENYIPRKEAIQSGGNKVSIQKE
jgi:hypothetical protein